MTPQIQDKFGGIIMSKLSKQDKIEIFNLWQNYQVVATELSRRYQVYSSTINYLLALINRYGTAILDRPYTSYSIAFKEQAIKLVLVKNEAIYQVALEANRRERIRKKIERLNRSAE